MKTRGKNLRRKGVHEMESQYQELDNYYLRVQKAGKLLSSAQALQWSTGTLKTLGLSVDRRTKRALAKELPEELAKQLTSVFWLLHFRDPNQSAAEFRLKVARRSGNTDSEFAQYPILAVFSGIKSLIDFDLSGRVSRSLSPEIRDIWIRAESVSDDVGTKREYHRP
jgi:uncharacterized protein (DUF2267 family)